MRLSTSGSLRRIDLSLVVQAIPVLREEWAALRFDRDGLVVNPLTGASMPQLRLLGGTHRQPGAQYESVTQVEPVEGLEHLALPTEHRTRFTLTRDDAIALAGTLRPGTGDLWSADVALTHGRLPRVDVTTRYDVTQQIRAEGTPGCVAGLLGGVAAGSAQVDLATLEGRGTLARADGGFNRFRGDGWLDLAARGSCWDVKGKARLRGRGLGRIAMLVLQARIRNEVEKALADFWADADRQLAEIDRELHRARTVVEHEGGLRTVVHHVLWDAGYADRMDEKWSSPPS